MPKPIKPTIQLQGSSKDFEQLGKKIAHLFSLAEVFEVADFSKLDHTSANCAMSAISHQLAEISEIYNTFIPISQQESNS